MVNDLEAHDPISSPLFVALSKPEWFLEPNE